MQAHLISDAFANAMGWTAAWLAWWAMLLATMLLANFGGVLPSICNGMHAFPLGVLAMALAMLVLLMTILARAPKVGAVTGTESATSFLSCRTTIVTFFSFLFAVSRLSGGQQQSAVRAWLSTLGDSGICRRGSFWDGAFPLFVRWVSLDLMCVVLPSTKIHQP